MPRRDARGRFTSSKGSVFGAIMLTLFILYLIGKSSGPSGNRTPVALQQPVSTGNSWAGDPGAENRAQVEARIQAIEAAQLLADQAAAKKQAEAAEAAKRAADERAAAAKAEADQREEEMLVYELAKLTYDAAWKLDASRKLDDLSLNAKSKGNDREYQRLRDRARERLQEVVQYYSDTEASADAKLLLAGGPRPGPRSLPPLPVLPKSVVADAKEFPQERPDLIAMAPSGPSVTTAGGNKTVAVRSYTRADGTQVQAHTRSAPSGGGRR